LEGSICLGLHLIGLRQSITTAGTFCEILVLMKLPAAILAGNVTTLDIMITENDFEMISEAEEWKFHSLVMVHYIMGM
jgi:nitrate reductase gamma subunit